MEGDILEEDLSAVPASESHFAVLFRDATSRQACHAHTRSGVVQLRSQAWEDFSGLPDAKQEAVLSASAPATPLRRTPAHIDCNAHERYACVNRAARSILRKSMQCRAAVQAMEAAILDRLHDNAAAVVAFSFEQKYEAQLLQGLCQFHNLACLVDATPAGTHVAAVSARGAAFRCGPVCIACTLTVPVPPCALRPTLPWCSPAAEVHPRRRVAYLPALISNALSKKHFPNNGCSPNARLRRPRRSAGRSERSCRTR